MFEKSYFNMNGEIISHSFVRNPPVQEATPHSSSAGGSGGGSMLQASNVLPPCHRELSALGLRFTLVHLLTEAGVIHTGSVDFDCVNDVIASLFFYSYVI